MIYRKFDGQIGQIGQIGLICLIPEILHLMACI
jgi:hypothetical protein